MLPKIMPNLFIVGAAKAGTTSLYKYLSQHPGVYMSRIKEPNFFSQARSRRQVVWDESRYYALFKGARDYSIVGEASPSYLWDKNSPHRIKEANPKARIIILLREPIERAFSHYLMDVRAGIQRKSFADALAEDYALRSKEWGVSHLYVELGLYYEQIARYLDVFSSSQILILYFEELKNDTKKVLKKVFTFLDVSLLPLEDIDFQTKHNTFSLPRGKIIGGLLSISSLVNPAMKLLPQWSKNIINTIIYREASKPELEKSAKEFLYNIYVKEITNLRAILNNPLLWSDTYE
ncbi:Sulfotransferase domain-containing protein [Desulfotomaculum arcticum]|uniref:Sulfotransferase domain-containing protein n=1 Tax=Desulfotruncus arcticus DSM 17038 TaxID=1121424 RepID=A0A1I2QA88_9FIRM|nr:sulfotransferase [Desulfotruncus arcticus]SFG22561.1 Sulfotransferase domain-containing protein [Desulfotomaculum arcticum] [Desulfotruncus arcticus DSM 17038]